MKKVISQEDLASPYSRANKDTFKRWCADWNLFAREALHVSLDKEQQEILSAVQHNKMVAVASGTARGKDYVAAVAALCFMYLSPRWNAKGELVRNTKIALTAPTGRQVSNIMYPEIVRMFNKAGGLEGRLVGNDIRTPYAEWFLTGFKADDKNTEAWSGFHAVNTMFVVTEASGISEETFAAIEGNLQANSKMLIVFNPNNSVGYAARAMRSPRWKAYRLDDLSAPNVLQKKEVYPGQVDYNWVKDKVATWCMKITPEDFNEGEGDFKFEGQAYRPNDLFRIKVRGLFPKVSEDVLIPYYWVELAQERYKEWVAAGSQLTGYRKIGADIAGMGTDSSVFVHRFEHVVNMIQAYQSGGEADHMMLAGLLKNWLEGNVQVYVDTIGEGAGVYSRLVEMGYGKKAYSCKFSEGAEGLSDLTGEYAFANMRAYLYWAVRDWLNPAHGSIACLPSNDQLTQELCEVKYKVQSNGKIIIEPKDDIKVRLGRSPDYSDALAQTFYPGHPKSGYLTIEQIANMI